MEAIDMPVMKNFLRGQYGNLFKFSLWWTSLAPLTFALLDSSAAVGVGRIVYNFALCIFSPLGAILAERVPAKKILVRAALGRFAVWCIALPLVWTMQASSDAKELYWESYTAFCIMLFIDGLVVAGSTLLDVDVAGVDTVASAYNIEVDEASRNSFNSRNEAFFSASFIFFAPVMAWGGLLYRQVVRNYEPTWRPEVVASGTLTSVFVVTFLLATVVQLVFFTRMPNPPEAPPPESINDLEGPAPMATIKEKISETIVDLKSAMQVFKEHPAILFRVIFLGLEIAVEDAAIVVIAAHCGVKLHWMGNGDPVEGNIWSAMSVCCGKIGAAIASVWMLKGFVPPPNYRQFWPLFLLVFCSSVSAAGFPLSVYLEQQGYVGENGARVVYFTTCFLFFFFSTMPKVGFMCLLQTMASVVPNGHRAFGFIAIVATILDGVVVMGLTLLFEKMTILNALIGTFGFFLLHGIVELLLGPTLVLTKAAESDRYSNQQASSLATLSARSFSSMGDSPRNSPRSQRLLEDM